MRPLRLLRASTTWLLAATACASFAAGGAASKTETVVVDAVRDNTLIETADGSLSNGRGPLFVGRTRQVEGSRRRGLVAFDVAAAIPAKAQVEEASLTLTCTGAPDGRGLALHRASARWGEGDSMFDGGRGAPTASGDATWTFAVFDTQPWRKPGGDFADTPSATTRTGGGLAVWTGLGSDVQGWLDRPDEDFGWVVVGQEDELGTASRCFSREAADATTHPRLTVSFRPRS